MSEGGKEEPRHRPTPSIHSNHSSRPSPRPSPGPRLTQGNQLAVELLLGAGADAYAADSRGRTPLDLARQAGKQAVVPLLEATPAPPSAPLCP